MGTGETNGVIPTTGKLREDELSLSCALCNLYQLLCPSKLYLNSQGLNVLFGVKNTPLHCALSL